MTFNWWESKSPSHLEGESFHPSSFILFYWLPCLKALGKVLLMELTQVLGKVLLMELTQALGKNLLLELTQD